MINGKVLVCGLARSGYAAAKLLVSRCNVLLLDEPTNYLDMPSLLALQNILCEYEGALVFVSHDAEFTDAVATEKIIIKNKKLVVDEERDSTDADVLLREHKLALLAAEIANAGEDEKEELFARYIQIKNT